MSVDLMSRRRYNSIHEEPVEAVREGADASHGLEG